MDDISLNVLERTNSGFMIAGEDTDLERKAEHLTGTTGRRLLPNEKICMSIMEAAEYSSIGHNKLREIVAENPDLDFVLHKGTKQVLIKRPQFEEWIAGINYI